MKKYFIFLLFFIVYVIYSDENLNKEFEHFINDNVFYDYSGDRNAKQYILDNTFYKIELWDIRDLLLEVKNGWFGGSFAIRGVGLKDYKLNKIKNTYIIMGMADNQEMEIDFVVNDKFVDICFKKYNYYDNAVFSCYLSKDKNLINKIKDDQKKWFYSTYKDVENNVFKISSDNKIIFNDNTYNYKIEYVYYYYSQPLTRVNDLIVLELENYKGIYIRINNKKIYLNKIGKVSGAYGGYSYEE